MDFTIEGLEVEEKIGSGGFGAVYRATDRVHGRLVAVKVLEPVVDEAARRRFDRERQAMGRLSGHPNIAVVHTSGFTARDEPYLVMELLQRGSLADRLVDGPMPVDEVVPLGVDLADALERAHALGVLHLDLKPANILISDFGRPKIVDFGIAALAGDDAATKTIRATPAYADPQVLDGKAPTEQSDVYGLAAALYALLTGGAPYDGDSDSAIAVLRRVALDPVPRLDRPGMPDELTSLLSEAMAKDPAERPASMREFADRLRVVRAGVTGPADTPDRRGAPPTAVVSTTSDPGDPNDPNDRIDRIDPTRAPSGSAPTAGAVAGGAAPPSGPAPIPQPAGAASERTEPRRSRSPLVIGASLAAVAALVIGLMVVGGGGDDDGPADAASTVPATTPEPTAAPASDAPATDPTTPPDPAPTTSELARSVVQIRLLRDGTTTCTGSGTIIDEDGTILTNSHVIAQSRTCLYDTIGVAITDDAGTTPNLAYAADVLVDDPLLDIAVVRIARTLDGAPVDASFVPVAIGDSDGIDLGDRLRVIGYPGIGGETVTVTEGSVSGFAADAEFGDRAWLKTDATIAGGNSGGLAANSSGEIIGVPTIVGTGAGQVTDCRIITDTNRDGFVDENDTCVPTGGFINGIRPVNLALGAITAAATATPVTPQLPQPPPTTVPATTPAPGDAPQPIVTRGVFAVELDDNGFPATPAVVVPAGAPQLCLTWDYRRVPIGAPIAVEWYVDGVLDPAAGFAGTNTVVDGSFFACISNPDGLAAGLYEAVWLVGGERVFSSAIYVGGDRVALDISVVNAGAVPICSLYWTPVDADGLGLSRLPEPIPPGEQRTVRIASGTYRTLVFDCDDALVFEDSGFELTRDITTLTVGT